MKMHGFRLIHQKLNQKGFFGHIFVAGLFKTQSTTKNFLGNFFMNTNINRLIHQKLNDKGFFGHIFVARLFKIQFPTKNF